jgi:hypothetical protein
MMQTAQITGNVNGNCGSGHPNGVIVHRLEMLHIFCYQNGKLATGWTTEEIVFESRQGQAFAVFSEVSITVLLSTQPSIRFLTRVGGRGTSLG